MTQGHEFIKTNTYFSCAVFGLEIVPIFNPPLRRILGTMGGGQRKQCKETKLSCEVAHAHLHV